MINAIKEYITPDEIFARNVLLVGSVDGFREYVKSHDPLMYVEVNNYMGKSTDALCDVRNLIKTFDLESFDIIVCTTLDTIYDWRMAIHNLKSVCKTGGILLICNQSYSEWKLQKLTSKIFADFNILNINPLKAVKVNSMEVNLKDIKPKRGRKKKIKEPMPKYIGDVELYFPRFRKIVNKGDLFPELPLWEARERKDFVVLNDKGE